MHLLTTSNLRFVDKIISHRSHRFLWMLFVDGEGFMIFSPLKIP